MWKKDGWACKWLMNEWVEARSWLIMKGHWLTVLVCFNDLKIYWQYITMVTLSGNVSYTCSISLCLWKADLNDWEYNPLCMSRQIIVQHNTANFESNKAERYTEPSRIKRLPDVGMVKVCLEASEYWLGWYSVTIYTSLFLNFFHQLVFPCSYWWHQRHSPPSLHLYLFLWEAFLRPRTSLGERKRAPSNV